MISPAGKRGEKAESGVPRASTNGIVALGVVTSVAFLVEMFSLGRVGMWRGGGRIGLSVSAPFVWRCLTRAISQLTES